MKKDLKMDIEEINKKVRDCAFEVHSTLGAGLFEKT